MELDQIICGDCLEVMKDMPDNSVDLVVTSPPYDDLREYKGYAFEFKLIAEQLFRVVKHGGVLVWIVGDAIINGSETGSSFFQALWFKDLGFKLHDTMIYHRQAANPSSNRYWQNFEYMFVLSKGKPSTINLLKDRKNKYTKMGGDHVRQKDGSCLSGERSGIAFDEFGYRENIWYYGVGKGNSSKDAIAFDHPAIFPEHLAFDHIRSWSNKSDLVLDPMCGSGTTCKMAKILDRHYIGIDISEKYCEIARKRVEAAEKGITVKELEKGQGVLF